MKTGLGTSRHACRDEFSTKKGQTTLHTDLVVVKGGDFIKLKLHVMKSLAK